MPLNVEELKSNLDTIKATYQEEGKKTIQLCLKEFFNQYPEIKKIAWSQYTPYFNDGDECIFSVNDIFFLNEDYGLGDPGTGFGYGGEPTAIETIESLYEFEELCQSNNPNNSEQLKKDIKSIRSLFHSNDSILQELFGDHVEIHATADGVRVEEYDHE